MFVGFLFGLGWVIYKAPLAFAVFIAAIALVGWITQKKHDRRCRQLAEARPGNALCSFARAFDCRATDTWLIRAVFEELQPLFPKTLRPFPLGPEDRLLKDLDIDSDELAEAVGNIASRAGYSLEETKHNPFYERVETVRDLVAFLSHQPVDIHCVRR